MEKIIARIIIVTLFAISLVKPLPAISQRLQTGDSTWIQQVIDSWKNICEKKLKIEPGELPWIIFYDSSVAWHLNPEPQLLISHEKTNNSFQYSGRNYSLIKINHSGTIWVPGRESVAISNIPMATMPYANNKKTFFIAPLPGLFHKLAPSDQWKFVDLLFFSSTAHELTHTRQLPFVLPELEAARKKYKLPISIDDNIIETAFGKDERFTKLFQEEMRCFFNAVQNNNRDSSIALIKNALAIRDVRVKEFFSGDNEGYIPMEIIFTGLEGSAMWAQYQSIVYNVEDSSQHPQILQWLLERSQSWVQNNGLAIFVLIDRFQKDWQKLYFGKEIPSPYTVLAKAIR